MSNDLSTIVRYMYLPKKSVVAHLSEIFIKLFLYFLPIIVGNLCNDS